jgi:hypothetical protein
LVGAKKEKAIPIILLYFVHLFNIIYNFLKCKLEKFGGCSLGEHPPCDIRWAKPSFTSAHPVNPPQDLSGPVKNPF